MVSYIPTFTFKFPESRTLCFLKCLLIFTKLLLLKALAHLGLYNTLLEDHLPYQENTARELENLPASSPIIPVSTLAAAIIKKRVPVIKYDEVLNRMGMGNVDKTTIGCSICLNSLQRCHDIRELSGCNHVFHKECLDRWVDSGHVACPLCRSMLFPVKGDISRFYADHLASELLRI